MKKLLLMCLTLSACSVQKTTDGYRFEVGADRVEAPQVVFVLHASQRELVRTAPPGVRYGREGVEAWSVLRGNQCIVHIVDPAVTYRPEFIGHEVTHCLYGQWHK